MEGNGEDGADFSLACTTNGKGMVVESCSRATQSWATLCAFESKLAFSRRLK